MLTFYLRIWNFSYLNFDMSDTKLLNLAIPDMENVKYTP